jgi:hypothetical protein
LPPPVAGWAIISSLSGSSSTSNNRLNEDKHRCPCM